MSEKLDEATIKLLPTLAIVLTEIERAKVKHPKFPRGAAAVAIIAEELGELAKEINDMYINPDFEETQVRITMEAAHVAVTAIRLIEENLSIKIKTENELKNEEK